MVSAIDTYYLRLKIGAFLEGIFISITESDSYFYCKLKIFNANV